MSGRRAFLAFLALTAGTAVQVEVAVALGHQLARRKWNAKLVNLLLEHRTK